MACYVHSCGGGHVMSDRNENHHAFSAPSCADVWHENWNGLPGQAKGAPFCANLVRKINCKPRSRVDGTRKGGGGEKQKVFLSILPQRNLPQKPAETFSWENPTNCVFLSPATNPLLFFSMYYVCGFDEKSSHARKIRVEISRFSVNDVAFFHRHNVH